MKKTFAVVGLGKFGFYVAKTLASEGHNVIAIDKDLKLVQEISDHVSSAVAINSSDMKQLEEAGIVDIDTVVVSIGENIEASILTVMALKELGNKVIIAKAINDIHGKILSQIGAFKVIYPEREAGERLVKNMLGNITLDIKHFSNSVKLVKFMCTSYTKGKSVEKLEAINNNKIKVISYKDSEKWHIEVNKQHIFEDGDMISIIGENEDIDKFCSEL